MRKQAGAMGSPYRSSYYKAAYEAAASGITSKRYLTREPSSRYYDDPDDRKRHRMDSGGHSQTSSRYSSHDEYPHHPHRSSTSSSYNGKGSSGYYEGSSHSHSRSDGRSSNGAYPPPLFRSSRDPEPSGSSSYSHSRDRGSSSRYTEHSSGSGRHEDLDRPSSSKSVPRRAPPHPGSQSSRSKSSSSMLAPTPLMKLTVNTEKDYIGSRYRQAPPEHHRENGHSSAYSSTSRHSPEHRSRPAASSRPSVPSRSSRPVLTKKPSRVSTVSASSRIRKRVMQRSARDREAQTRRILDLKSASSKAKSGSKPTVSARSASHKSRTSDAEKHPVSTKATDSGKSVAKISSSRKGSEARERSAERKKDKETKIKSEHVENTKSEAESSTDQVDKPVKTDTVTASSPEKGLAEKADTKSRNALLMLKCHYCDTRCLSWKEYTSHTRSYDHTKALNKAISKMRNEISSLRGKQREHQRQLEKSTAENKTLSDTTSYCRVCELNFRTDATEHESAELHNKIKGLIYQKCEVCDVEFRIWKVYMNHMTSLEHVKREAMLELQNREGRGEAVHGTNLSEKELGLNLVEEIQVLYCKACRRYVPIKDSALESKLEHCTTFNHVKSVDDHNAAEEREARRRLRQEEEKEKAKLAETAVSDPVAVDDTSEKSCSDLPSGTENAGTAESTTASEVEPMENVIIKEEVVVPEIVEPESSEKIMKMEIPDSVGEVQREEDEDDDEIELHADADVDADEEDSEIGNSWGRRTRSRTSKSSTGGGGN